MKMRRSKFSELFKACDRLRRSRLMLGIYVGSANPAEVEYWATSVTAWRQSRRDWVEILSRA